MMEIRKNIGHKEKRRKGKQGKQRPMPSLPASFKATLCHVIAFQRVLPFLEMDTDKRCFQPKLAWGILVKIESVKQECGALPDRISVFEVTLTCTLIHIMDSIRSLIY